MIKCRPLKTCPLSRCRWAHPTLQRAYSVCQQLMHFFHQYLLYVTFEVLEPLWHSMFAQCRQATTVDQASPSSLWQQLCMHLT